MMECSRIWTGEVSEVTELALYTIEGRAVLPEPLPFNSATGENAEQKGMVLDNRGMEGAQ